MSSDTRRQARPTLSAKVTLFVSCLANSQRSRSHFPGEGASLVDCLLYTF
uniref:Uncharacterized protein n=1 Tax=Arundo donax TaxID=35708 RepID=A0A0A9AP74_ARUDO